MAITLLGEVVDSSAAPAAAELALARLATHHPDVTARLEADPVLATAVVTVVAASRSLTQLLAVDPGAVDVLADLDRRRLPEAATTGELVRWKRLEYLRIAARDLLGLDGLDLVGAALAEMAEDVMRGALRLAGVEGGLAVIGMGKLGGRELNYASDIDLMFVGEANPLPALEVARRCFRVDTDLRPEGRSGRLILPLSSYEAYWDRWAKPWEFQALLKARPVAGDPDIGAAFAEAAARRVWDRPFGAEDLRAVRDMKARAESSVARKGLADREVKRGRGGIRDAEFAVQLLQLVHGRQDPALRSRTTLSALEELAAAGYVAPADAAVLARGYTYLRTVEHRLQLDDEQQVHAVPQDPEARARLARVMGYRDDAAGTALARFDDELRRHQVAVRSVHEQLYFRPLLEAFAGNDAALTPEAIEARLSAFGFAEADRTRRTLRQLTRGLTRSSRLMQQMLPLVLDWLSKSPDPDLGLLGLGNLVARADQVPGLVATFRESPEAARRLCLLLGTSRLFHRAVEQHPETLMDLTEDEALRPRSRSALMTSAATALEWRGDVEARREALTRFKRAELLRIAAGGVLGINDAGAIAHGLGDLAEVVLEAALEAIAPPVPMAIIAMGRLGGAELAYPSDLDVLIIYEGESPDAFTAAEAAASSLLRFLNGRTPDAAIYHMDVGLRPEGRQGHLVRSLEGYRAYYQRWSHTWERQALLRARPVAGDPEVAAKFMAIIDAHLARPVTGEEVREIRRMKIRIERERIPPREDPQFHLKLGKGTISDVEWTVQLLQLRHGLRSPGTMTALAELEATGALSPADAAALRESYVFCERTRNHWFLVKGTRGDSLPTETEQLAHLARSLGTTAWDLREEYRRVTRRARSVMERLFYGKED
ncbi:MAG: [glutamine synthetase] adenylyltransferase / [glutamine synthetase]-adenylyl-L-tyrosine [Actinomycetota bacterium]|nr:[glutamine synthetase] adenylyltransferase / [glutamine synthetase]-adenylyl-L-tyrosine [Actinomycetota bacterium]